MADNLTSMNATLHAASETISSPVKTASTSGSLTSLSKYLSSLMIITTFEASQHPNDSSNCVEGIEDSLSAGNQLETKSTSVNGDVTSAATSPTSDDSTIIKPVVSCSPNHSIDEDVVSGNLDGEYISEPPMLYHAKPHRGTPHRGTPYRGPPPRGPPYHGPPPRGPPYRGPPPRGHHPRIDPRSNRGRVDHRFQQHPSHFPAQPQPVLMGGFYANQSHSRGGNGRWRGEGRQNPDRTPQRPPQYRQYPVYYQDEGCCGSCPCCCCCCG